ncbi:MAG: hypothetical protein ACK42Y_09250 [Candidatus Thermochlorobacter sp.]
MAQLVLALLFVCPMLEIYAQPKPKLTSAVFADLYAEHLVQTLLQHAVPRTLLFTPAPTHTFQGLLDAALQSRLLEAGFTLYERESLDAHNYAILDARATQANLSYQFLNDAQVMRKFELYLECKATSAQKQTLLVHAHLLAFQDTLRVDALTESEDKRFAETFKPELPSFWERVAMPAAIVGAIGIIVFLFFSVRSR